MGFRFIVRDQEVDGSNPFAPTNSFRTNDLQHTRNRRHPGCGLGIRFSNRLHATNLSRLNSVSYSEKCTTRQVPGLWKLSTRSHFWKKNQITISSPAPCTVKT